MFISAGTTKPHLLKALCLLAVMIPLILILGCGGCGKRKSSSLPVAKTEVNHDGLAQKSRTCVITFAAPHKGQYEHIYEETFPHLVHTLLADYLTRVSRQMGQQKLVEILPVEYAEQSGFYRSLRDKQDLGVYPEVDEKRLLAEIAKLYSYRAGDPLRFWRFLPRGQSKELTSADSRLIVIDTSEQKTIRQIADEIKADSFLSVRSNYGIETTWAAPSIGVWTTAELYDTEGKVIWKTTEPIEYHETIPMNRLRSLWMGFHKSVAFINLTKGERKYVLNAIMSSAAKLHDQMAKSISDALNRDIREARAGR